MTGVGLLPLAGYTCSRPFWDLLAQTVSHPRYIFYWSFCPYTITGLGLAGVGVIVLLTGFIGLRNWSESWTLPLTWLALVAPVLATAMLPGNVLREVAGVVTVAFALVIIGLWWWWGRA